MRSYGELLGYFKSREQPEDITPLLDDRELQNALVSWPKVRVGIKKEAAAGCNSVDEHYQWKWLWDNTNIDLAAFGVMSGTKAQNSFDCFSRMKNLRLIYPDGSIHKLAKDYLQSVILAKLHAATRVKRGVKKDSA